MKGWKSNYYANRCEMKARVAILIQTRLWKQTVTRDQEGHFINQKGNNPTRRYTNGKYLPNQHGSTQMYKASNNKH